MNSKYWPSFTGARAIHIIANLRAEPLACAFGLYYDTSHQSSNIRFTAPSSGGISIGAPAACMANLRPFSPQPVAMNRTFGVGVMNPRPIDTRTPAIEAAAAGAASTPASGPALRIAHGMLLSVTSPYAPPLSRTASVALRG